MIYGRDGGSFSRRNGLHRRRRLDALVRGGHDVTALVRDNEKAGRVRKRGAHAVIGNLAGGQGRDTRG
jgi:hypothetical protein